MPESTFSLDLEAALAGLASARAGLISTVKVLSQEDLDRLGGADEWSPRRIFEHVIQSEHFYAMLVDQLQGRQAHPPPHIACAGISNDEILSRLETSHGVFLSAIKNVDEQTFYREKPLGGRRISVLGVMNHSAEHDTDHTAQIKALLEQCP